MNEIKNNLDAIGAFYMETFNEVITAFSGADWSTIALAAIFILAFIGYLGGMIKTFKRNLIGAILCMFLLFPVWMIWAFIEIFTGKIDKNIYVVVNDKGDRV